MNKKFVMLVALMLVSLAVLLPFASSNPDGLEKVTETFGAGEQTSIWGGLMPDYSVATLSNSYISTLAAGLIGTVIVLGAGLLLGKTFPKKSVVQVEENK